MNKNTIICGVCAAGGAMLVAFMGDTLPLALVVPIFIICGLVFGFVGAGVLVSLMCWVLWLLSGRKESKPDRRQRRVSRKQPSTRGARSLPSDAESGGTLGTSWRS